MKNFNLPKTLVLDLKKWRCGYGGNSECKLGTGPTKLLNKKGKMCCLGQFAEQAGIPKASLLDVGMPGSIYLDKSCVILEKFTSVGKNNSGFSFDSPLAYDCVGINDDKKTSINKKIKLLREILKNAGVKLKVINKSVLKDKK